ncbi:phosphopantetheine-binding protein [Mangrovicoccus algicola]|uniref:Phosphopantetheine-binding protein n=1 Tax=Mangrovicoccus algicola TaxID=2771008 RepID=A0A8J7CW35_9RHOB|nr:phosphopantetheine-binding protein [Mangrovicoccus algicola]MBE3637272.1 phosphopantetheine-binding protein [Mangrovicoccus algicola]
MTTAPLTRAQMRADIAAQLGIDPEEIGGGDSLLDLGLDSVRLLKLVTAWEAALPGLDYTRFVEVETLDEWWDIVAETQARA